MSTFPGSLVSEPYDLATGFPEFVYGTSPAAGANFSYNLDSRWVQRLISIKFTLATDSNAANRILQVNYCDQAGNIWLINGPTNFVPASVTSVTFQGDMYREASDFNSSGSDYSTTFFGIAPIFLYNTTKITLTVTNIQAGDQISGIVMLFERWDSQPHYLYTGPHTPPSVRPH